MVKKFARFYPFYFAIFPIVSFYVGNRKELQLETIMFPILYSMIFLLLLRVFIKRVFKDGDKADLFAFTTVLYFFSYGYYLKKIQVLGIKNWLVFVIYTLFFVGVLWVLTRFKKNFKLPIFFSIAGIYLLISSSVVIIPYEVQRQAIRSRNINLSDGWLLPIQKKDVPDVYYLILDRYANGRVLKEQYGFDNKAFYDFLQKKGFYVAGESFANYPKTHLSLGSSLNLDYLTDLVKKVGEENSDYTPAFSLVQENKIAQFFKSSGYRYIYFGDWWGPTNVSKLADRNINLYANSSEMIRKFLQTTILVLLTGNYYKGNRLFGFFHDRIYENTNYKFEKLEQIAQEKSPKFIFAHMLFPHYPYLFDKDCRRVADDRNKSEDEKYIEQLQCVNKKIQKAIEAILRQSKKPPIIVLQSDEGPFKIDEMKRDGEEIDWTKISDAAIRRHMTILNAYYLPDFDNNKLYPSITPVNTFRLILNHYFGADFKLLPDKSYIIPNLNRPYKYLDITNKVKFNQ